MDPDLAARAARGAEGDVGSGRRSPGHRRSGLRPFETGSDGNFKDMRGYPNNGTRDAKKVYELGPLLAFGVSEYVFSGHDLSVYLVVIRNEFMAHIGFPYLKNCRDGLA